MYALARNDLDISGLTMTNEDALFPASNVLNKYTQGVAKSTTNTAIFSYSATDLSDIDLFNTNALSGTVTIKDAVTPFAILATETIDFTTTTDISYMTTDDITYYKNLRAFHGDQFYNNVTVEIELTSDVGVPLELGIIASGIFVRYGGSSEIKTSKEGLTYSVTSTIAEFNALLNKVNSKNEFFLHHYQTYVTGENMWISYGIPKIGKSTQAGVTHLKYTVEVKA